MRSLNRRTLLRRTRFLGDTRTVYASSTLRRRIQDYRRYIGGILQTRAFLLDFSIGRRVSDIPIVGTRQRSYERLMRVRIIRPVVVEFVSHDWRRGEAVRLRDPQGRRIRGQLGWILNSELKNCGLKIITKFTTEFFLDIKL